MLKVDTEKNNETKEPKFEQMVKVTISFTYPPDIDPAREIANFIVWDGLDLPTLVNDEGWIYYSDEENKLPDGQTVHTSVLFVEPSQIEVRPYAGPSYEELSEKLQELNGDYGALGSWTAQYSRKEPK